MTGPTAEIGCSTPRRALTMLAIGVLAGCTTAPAPDQMSRSTLETAPADLQLLCAGAVAKSTGADQSKVLPTSSKKLDNKTYQVEFDTGGKRSGCVIDTDGKVVSVQPI
ncbi:hypothetical protein [Mesorhizobium koreense]|uniref:hypothetical protein n=1 Tax=Mesorhizobium koreense TaxID=3074855 RepID=UPI00287B5F84|nr:hypothetical protein [Mesorhizobium sp. WR6]